MRLEQIWRFPFKGFSGQQANTMAVEANRLLPGDRQFAISTGHPASNEKLSSGWCAKRHFIQQSMVPELAGYQLEYTPETAEFSLYKSGKHLITAPHNGRHLITQTLATEIPRAFSGTPQLVELGDGGYTDTAAPWISLCSTASLTAFASATHTVPDNRRFRLNLVIEHDTPFDEFSWAGHSIMIGDHVRIEIIEPVGRCSAINVHPDNAQIDADHLARMPILFGHSDLGMFARILEGGIINKGDEVRLGNRL